MRQSHKPQGSMTVVPWPRDSQGLGEAQDHVQTTVRANSRAIQRGRVRVGGRGREHVLGACSMLCSLLYREDNAISYNSRGRQVLLLPRSSWDARPLHIWDPDHACPLRALRMALGLLSKALAKWELARHSNPLEERRVAGPEVLHTEAHRGGCSRPQTLPTLTSPPESTQEV